jgi:hypothetical protein
MRHKQRKPRLPSAAEKIHGLLRQRPAGPVPPAGLIVQLSRMAGPDPLDRLASRTPPIQSTPPQAVDIICRSATVDIDPSRRTSR